MLNGNCMKKRLIKTLVISVTLSLMLLFVSSCRKTSDNMNETLVTSSYNKRDPLIVVPEPVVEKKVIEKERVTESHEEVVQSEEKIEEKAETEEEKMDSSPVIVPQAPVFTEVVNSEVEEEVIISPLYSCVISPSGVDMNIDAYDGSMVITLPDYVKGEDIFGVLALLGEKEYEYTSSDNTLTIFYETSSYDEVRSYISDIEKAVDSYLVTPEKVESPSSFTFTVNSFSDVTLSLTLSNTTLDIHPSRLLSDEERESLVSLISDNINGVSSVSFDNGTGALGFSFESVDDESLLEVYSMLLGKLAGYKVQSDVEDNGGDIQTKKVEEERTVVVTPARALKKKDLMPSLDVSLSPSLYYDITHNALRGGVYGRFALTLFDSYSFGIKSGYDFGRYLVLSGYAQVDLFDFMYINIGAGYKFDLSKEKKYSSFLCDLSLGYRKDIITDLSIFGEAGITYAPHSYSRFTPILSLGVGYRFNF